MSTEKTTTIDPEVQLRQDYNEYLAELAADEEAGKPMTFPQFKTKQKGFAGSAPTPGATAPNTTPAALSKAEQSRIIYADGVAKGQARKDIIKRFQTEISPEPCTPKGANTYYANIQTKLKEDAAKRLAAEADQIEAETAELLAADLVDTTAANVANVANVAANDEADLEVEDAA